VDTDVLITDAVRHGHQLRDGDPHESRHRRRSGFNGAPPAGISASYDAGTHVLTLSGTASLAAYQAALAADHDSTIRAQPSTETRIIDVVVNDGTADSNLAQAIIEVTEVNALAPVVDLDPTIRRSSERASVPRSPKAGRRFPIAAHRHVDHRCRQHDAGFGDPSTLKNPQGRRPAGGFRRPAGRHHSIRLRPGHRTPDALGRR
jgi:hypothetical protein